MWNEPTKERLAQLPRLYGTEDVKLEDKLIYLHFFMGGCDWFIAEYDGDDLFFGYAILGGDHVNAEWGYIVFSELRELKLGFVEVDCELDKFWEVKAAKEIPHIKCI